MQPCETAEVSFSFPLDGEDRTIGRDQTCDAQINGVGISRHHAIVRCNPSSPLVIDTESTYGIRLNGTALHEGVLENGSVLTFGIQQFHVEIKESSILFRAETAPGETVKNSGISDRIRIGRSSENDICLAHPMVSRFHCSVSKSSDGLVIADHGSANCTFVNGRPIKSTVLKNGDAVHVGPFRFFVCDGTLQRADDLDRIRIEAVGLGYEIRNKVLIENVNLTVEPGAFMAVLGLSGAGKSTLSKILSGQICPTSGYLYFNGFSADKFRNAFSRSIGYVSQQILLRPELTVWETLVEQCNLRLPFDSIQEERLLRAREILILMELGAARNRRVGDLSGGEARRLHVGVELLSSPSVLILDEPLAGLDPGLVRRFMALFRRICDRGHTLLLTTHTLEQIDTCDRVVFMDEGKVLFTGIPQDLCAHFKVENLAQVYEKISSGQTFLSDVQSNTLPDSAVVTPFSAQEKKPSAFRVVLPESLFHQTVVLFKRYAKILYRDKRNLFLLLMQTPLFAVLLGLVYKTNSSLLGSSFYFCLTITAIWVGGLATVKEIVREWMLLWREARCGMHLFSFIAARILAAAGLSGVQAFLFTLSLAMVFGNIHFSFDLFLLLYVSVFSGSLLGLVVSASSRTVGRAISLLPVVLIPQIFFSGILLPFEHMAALGRLLSHLTLSRPVFSLMKKVFLLQWPLFDSGEWSELFLLCTGLIILFWTVLVKRIRSVLN